jgi:hypothetical protein
MKLKELSEAIATTCNIRSNVVTAVQDETFRQVRAAIEKGERVIVPEFGIFMIKDVPGEDGAPGKRIVRFREKSGEKKKGGGKKKKAENAGGDDGD